MHGPQPQLSGRVVLALFAAAGLSGGQELKADQNRPNVLFIAVDDLNHWVGHLGRNAQTLTPHIDRLAASGVTFSHAYCAAPVCNPSRTALLSGLRPSTSGVYQNGQLWLDAIPEGTTLPHQFKKAGYYTAGAGKIYHGRIRDAEWDEYFPSGGDGPPTGKLYNAGRLQLGQLDCPDEEMGDYRIASWIIERLRQQRDRPYFLACGLHKPHLPWRVPRKYFDLHPLDQIQLPKVTENDLEDLPPEGQKMALRLGDHAAIIKSGTWKEAVQAYLAACSFADAMIGRVVEALDSSPARENTIVVLWGDHGWHLGEKEHWRKFALWEEATRAPFIWRAPGLTPKGAVSERTVDFMAIYPTLMDLCGLPTPKHVEGASIRPLLRDPRAEWTTPALTTHEYMNHAVRSQHWRYIRYREGGEELYDHEKDPYEWKNLAGEPPMEKVKADLSKWLPKVNHRR
ncbi:MAG: iduronate-2-sulfatase [Phycisphaerae bacterium]